jgi:hypothetical protein
MQRLQQNTFLHRYIKQHQRPPRGYGYTERLYHGRHNRLKFLNNSPTSRRRDTVEMADLLCVRWHGALLAGFPPISRFGLALSAAERRHRRLRTCDSDTLINWSTVIEHCMLIHRESDVELRADSWAHWGRSRMSAIRLVWFPTCLKKVQFASVKKTVNKKNLIF